MVPFKNKDYYKPEMKGSYSIKSVLPALCPDLSYDELDIKEGDIMNLFATFPEFCRNSPNFSCHFLSTSIYNDLLDDSCSAALICEFCATRRIRFDVSDLFQK